MLGLLVMILSSIMAATADNKPCTTYDTDGTFYDLNPMASSTDYYFKSFGGHEFYLNVCKSVRTDTWALEDPDQVGGFLREDRGDFSIGKANTTLQIRDGHPLMILIEGSKCPGSTDLKASTAIRFICDRSVFSAGKPQLIAELPPHDEQACAFFIEWRTHVACPTAEPGGPWGILAVVIMTLIGAFMLFLIFYIVYHRFVHNQRRLSQPQNLSFSSLLDYLHDLYDRAGFRSDRWASDRSWQGFSSGGRGGGFERLPTIREEEQGMLRGDAQAEEDGGHESVTPTPAGIDAHGVIRL